MSEKYVSFRIEKKENNRVLAAINHDMRIGWQPKYIKRELSKKNITLIGSKMDKKRHKDLMAEQNKRSKRKIQKNTERFSAGIMTFSSSMSADQKMHPELFNECSKKFLSELNITHGLQIEYAEVHLDETTPHIHILFDNISKVDGKSIRRNINPKILSDIQTLMGKCFEPMGYQRGQDKNITRAEHLKVSDYRALEQREAELDQSIAQKEKQAEKVLKTDERMKKIYEAIESGEGNLTREDFDLYARHKGFERRFASKDEKKAIDKEMEKVFKHKTMS